MLITVKSFDVTSTNTGQTRKPLKVCAETLRERVCSVLNGSLMQSLYTKSCRHALQTSTSTAAKASYI